MKPYRQQIQKLSEAVTPASVVTNKLPQKFQMMNSLELLKEILAILRAQAISYQTCHWHVDGSSFYGNHLLFQRLYDGLQKEIDTLGEKMVSYYGENTIDAKDSIARVLKWLKEWKGDHWESGLQSEKDLQAILSHTYEKMKESKELSLGLDDFILTLANTHETNLYLLGQVKSGKSKEVYK